MNIEIQKSNPINKLISPDHPLGLADMPKLFRVTAIEQSNESGTGTVQANLFHECASLTVRYMSAQAVMQIKPGDLVSPRWQDSTTSDEGALNIRYLSQVERPNADENLFLTVPHEWVKDRGLISEAASLMESLPLPYRHLLNAIFWDGKRFQGLCTAPALTSSQDAVSDNGNLREALKVAGQILKKTRSHHLAVDAVAILAGFFQHAGVDDAHRHYGSDGAVPSTYQYRKITVIEWIAKARVQWHLSIPNDQYTALMRYLIPANQKPLERGKVESDA